MTCGLVENRMHAKISKLVNHVMGLSLITTTPVKSLARSGTCQMLRGRMSSALRLCNSSPRGLYFVYKSRNASRIPTELCGRRSMAWLPKLGAGLRPQQEQFNGPMDNQEEAAKVAILEKAMKGRQPTDLKLRCKLRFRTLAAEHI